MEAYYSQLGDTLGSISAAALPLVLWLGSAARQSFVIPTFPWVAFAMGLCLVLPVRFWEAPPKTWVRGVMLGVILFLAVATVGGILAGNV